MKTSILFSLIVFALFSCQSEPKEISYSSQADQTQKPVLHAKNWLAITGKPLGATAGAMMFQQGGNAV
ncbi:MAG: hypothetical protein KDE26_28925, partial [Bacteroidetes bacterium]|nr:hypothetical protein [Bacteroidota bacterium]